MKKIIQVMTVILFAVKAVAQPAPFNGEYKGASNGINYTLVLKNEGGVVTGTVKNDAYVGDPLSVQGTVFKANTMKGAQNNFGLKVKFIASEEAGVITWESKGWFLEVILTKKERTMKFSKVDQSTSASSNTGVRESNETDPALVGIWVHTETSKSVNGTVMNYKGLRLMENGICQRSSMVSIDGEKSGSLEDWQGSMKWYTVNRQLFIVVDGEVQLAGAYTVGDSGMILMNNEVEEYYSKR